MRFKTKLMNDELEPPKVNIGARIPAVWAEQLKELATSLNCSQTELITEAVGLYLEKQIDTLVDRVTALERKRDGFNDDGTVYPVISSEVIKKLEQVIEINQTLVKQNTEINQALIKENSEIKNQISNLSNQINNIKQQPPIERMTLVESISADKFTGGITQTELCERYGINPGSLAGIAKRERLSPQEYLKNLTSWRYLVRPGGKLGRWHPPDE